MNQALSIFQEMSVATIPTTPSLGNPWLHTHPKRGEYCEAGNMLNEALRSSAAVSER